MNTPEGRDATGSGGASADRPSAVVWLAPVAVVATAYALWWISDRLLYVGPLDRAAFGWIVVVPVLLAAPIIGGFAWRHLAPQRMAEAALAAGGVVAVAAAALLWRAVSEPGCATAPTRTATDWILPSLLVGGLVGLGVASGGLAAARLFSRGSRVAAVVAGAAVNGGMLVLALAFLGVLLASPGCDRPLAGG